MLFDMRLLKIANLQNNLSNVVCLTNNVFKNRPGKLCNRNAFNTSCYLQFAVPPGITDG